MIDWPDDLLRAGEWALNYTPRTLAGAAAIDSSSQVGSSGQGIWTGAINNILVESNAQIRAWRRLQAQCEGRLGKIRIFLGDWERVLQPFLADTSDALDPVAHSDGAFFSDASGYVSSGLIDITATSAANEGDATLAVTIAAADTIEPGMYFSIGDNLYKVKTATYATATTATLTFVPGLRANVAAGAWINFETPRVLMRLATDRELDATFQPPFYTKPSVNFVEAL